MFRKKLSKNIRTKCSGQNLDSLNGQQFPACRAGRGHQQTRVRHMLVTALQNPDFSGQGFALTRVNRDRVAEPQTFSCLRRGQRDAALQLDAVGAGALHDHETSIGLSLIHI